MSRHSSSGVSKRRFLKTLGGTGTAVAVAGCSGGGGGGNSSGSADLVAKSRIGHSDAKVTADFWALQGLSHHSKSAGKEYANTYKDWAKSHPSVKLDANIMTNYGQMQDKLLQAASAGGVPAVAAVDSFWVPNFYSDLAPVTEVKAGKADDYFKYVREEMTKDGEWRALWYQTDARALFYNQKMMDKYNGGNPPKTWDELIQVASEISKKEDMAGYIYNGGRWEATCFDNLAHFWGQGGTIVNDEREPVFHKGKNKEYLLNTFEFLHRTVESGATPKRVASIKDYARLRKEAMSGQAAMFLGGSFQVPLLKKQPKEKWKDWFVAEIPMKKPDMIATGAGGWTYGAFHPPKGNKDKMAAMKEFAGMPTKAEHMGEICKAAGGLPTRKSVYEKFPFFNEDKWQQVFLRLLKKGGHARPGGPIYSTFSNQWQIQLGKMITAQQGPKKAVNNLIDNTLSQVK